MRVVSGIQPSGILHIGNYVGAIKQWIELQDKHECFFMVVDLHAITVPYNKETFSDIVRNAARAYVAAGVDPLRATMFVQSHVPAHTELMWLLNTITPLGELERMTQFKEKAAKHTKDINAGLLNYPILQSADVLLYKAEGVPVGRDQVQHIELTRTLARRFNSKFAEIFPEPKEILPPFGEKIMSLIDPTKKMSKSDPVPSYIALFDEPSVIKEKIKAAVTDSGKEVVYNLKEKPAISNLMTMYYLFSGMNMKEIEEECKGVSYAGFKEKVAEAVIDGLRPIQEKHAELERDPEYIEHVLREGAEKARVIAAATLCEAKEAMGLLSQNF